MRTRRDTHELHRTFGTWTRLRAQPRISDSAEEELWQRVVDSARAIVADADAGRTLPPVPIEGERPMFEVVASYVVEVETCDCRPGIRCQHHTLP